MFLSNNMFTVDDRTHDWSDVSFSLTLALNKQVLVFLLEDIDDNLLRNRRDIKAALKVC